MSMVLLGQILVTGMGRSQRRMKNKNRYNRSETRELVRTEAEATPRGGIISMLIILGGDIDGIGALGE